MNYLKWRALKYEYIASFFLAIIVIVSFGLGKYLSLKDPWFYIPVLILWLIVVVILQFLSQRSQERQAHYIKGYKGENYVEEILKKLPANYRYIKSVKLENGNLDFLVISENGIFGIETKNQNGKITYDEKNKQLLRNYYPFRKNYLKQVKKSCWGINEIIKGRLNVDQFVMPVLVFSGLGVAIEIPSRADGVDVLSSKLLMNYLVKSRGGALSQSFQDDLYNIFAY